MGVKPDPKYSLERIDVNGDYYPENCKWASISEQNLNRRLTTKNRSGHVGVHWSKSNRRWKVTFKKDVVDYFINIDDAIKAREEAEKVYWGTPT